METEGRRAMKDSYSYECHEFRLFCAGAGARDVGYRADLVEEPGQSACLYSCRPQYRRVRRTFRATDAPLWQARLRSRLDRVDGGRCRSSRVVWERPFCRLIHFERQLAPRAPQPKLLIVAPMSGHYATLLRGTVEAFLPFYDVYITDWVDARKVPLPAAVSISTIISTT